MIFSKNSKGNQRKYTDEQIFRMSELRKSNLSYRKVGRFFNVSGSAVYQLLRKYKLLEIKNEVVPKGYVTLKYYAELNNEKYSTVYAQIKKEHIKSVKINNTLYVHVDSRMKRRTISEDKIERILKLSKTRYSYRKIGRLVGCSSITVKAYIDLLGEQL